MTDARLPGADAPTLAELGELGERWRRFVEMLDELYRAIEDRRRGQRPRRSDGVFPRFTDEEMAVLRDAVHVPRRVADGVDADDLIRILRRIESGWGRELRFDAGWHALAADLDRAMADVDPGYHLLRVKEKFGLLCWYYRPSDDSLRPLLDELVRATEEQAAHTCEVCGRPGVLRRGRFRVQTLCDPCWEAVGWR